MFNNNGLKLSDWESGPTLRQIVMDGANSLGYRKAPGPGAFRAFEKAR